MTTSSTALHKIKVPLVITVALKQELPYDMLCDLGYKPMTLRQLESEGASIIRTNIVIIITGVGPVNSQRAACFIRDHIDTECVVNLGTTGTTDLEIPLFTWIQPARLMTQADDSSPIDVFDALPLPWPIHKAPVKRGGTMISLSAPCHDQTTAPLLGQYFDMEAYAQGQIFAAADIVFHPLKLISDHIGRHNSNDFTHHLAQVRSCMAEILGFLSGPGPAQMSVIIPVHNRATGVGDAIDSVLRQSLPAFEIIVVNDGSDDATAARLASYGNQITTLTLTQNYGVSHARNIGIKAATAPWIAFLDSDDTWTKSKLKEQWDHLTVHPHYQMSQCEEIWIRSGKRVNRCKHHEKVSGWFFLPALQLCLVSPSAVIVKKTLLERYECFDETLPACEDYDLWLKILRHHPVGLNPHPSLIKSGGHEDQLSRRFTAMDRFRVQSLLKAYQTETNESYRQAIKSVVFKKASILAGGYQKRGQVDEAAFYESLLASL